MRPLRPAECVRDASATTSSWTADSLGRAVRAPIPVVEGLAAAVGRVTARGSVTHEKRK
jgi:hypothetical protein